jgi:hypothetical protein
MTAVARARTKTPAAHSTGETPPLRPCTVAGAHFQLLMHGLPARGFRIPPALPCGARNARLAGLPTICGCYETCGGCCSFTSGLGQVPGEEGGDSYKLTPWKCTADDARTATSAGPRQWR